MSSTQRRNAWEWRSVNLSWCAPAEMRAALVADALTMLEAFVGVGLVNAVQIQSFDDPRPILLVREQVRATGRAAHR
jgi:hypothetical protein